MRLSDQAPTATTGEGRGRQLRVLTELFFDRTFASELLAVEELAREKLLVALGVLGGGAALVSYILMRKYFWLTDSAGAWLDASAFASLVMCAMGLVSVLVWETLFVDGADLANLGALPVRATTVVAAKLAGLVVFATACAASMAVPSAAVFAAFLSRLHAAEPGWGLRFVAAHGIAMTAAGLVVFLACATLQGLLVVALGAARYRRASLLLRTSLVVAVMVLLSQVGTVQTAVAEAAAGDTAAVLMLPPLWFAGLEETILGTQHPVLARAASLAWGSLAGLALAAPALLLAGVRRVSELGDPQARHRTRPHAMRLGGRLARLVTRSGQERALLDFCGVCLWRSARHRLILASLAAAGVGLLLPWVVDAALTARDGRLDGAALALPHVLSFLLVVGARWGIARPAAPEASWVFRTIPLGDRSTVLDALRKAVIVHVLLPLHAVLLPVLSLLAGPGDASLHCLFSLSAAVVLADAMLCRFQRVPFASPGASGEGNLKSTWAVYLVALAVWSSTLARLEAHFLRSWPFWLAWTGLVAIGLSVTSHLRRGTCVGEAPPGFDDLPEPTFVALDLDG